jgi:hypothetical protein
MAYLSWLVFSRPVGAGAAGLILVIMLGCMSITIGGRTEMAQPADLLVQEGDVTVRGKGEVDVFYPISFSAPPNLIIAECFAMCEVVDQRPDHFRIKNTSLLPRSVNWTAKGTRCNGGNSSDPPSVAPPESSSAPRVGPPQPLSPTAKIGGPRYGL